ncbi:rhodanese-like domain-containing protein [Sphaerochaeta globosa]|uniref:Rhodanese-like protein n=1 Tax=Sphaerochaeta globosa (strain ATCC BAA-1886 / DSM 22777 / Buddy) TaxID=158189 RepID=F0RYN7_SPHGB|nr:rhodanese-like domain-containing protein [Sphaerochaeta globosa]ADY12880.1 Rhodanese-like protein [Sphaerochaeta globosa str. Buddy]
MSKIYIILLLILVIVLFVSFKNQQVKPVQGSAASYKKITAQEAMNLMQSGQKLTIVDVRTPSEYESGHIQGAINVPNESIATSVVSALPDLDATILVYCRSGARSAQAAKKLLAIGYTNVTDFGGIINWPYEVVR